MKFVTLRRDAAVAARSRKLTGAEGPIGSIRFNGMIWQNVAPESTLHTDGAGHYKFSLAF